MYELSTLAASGDSRNGARPIVPASRSCTHAGPGRNSLVDALYQEFTPCISSMIRRLADDPETRRDMKGEAYLLFRSLYDRFDPDRGVPLKPYLAAQLKVHLYSRCRSRRIAIRRETAMQDIDLFHFDTDPTAVWDREIEIRRLIDALPTLLSGVPERQRRAVIWRYYHDCSYDEIADRLCVRPATARSLLRHGLNRLRHLADVHGYE